MKVLLDECVDWRLLRDLGSYDVRTVKQLGWEKVKNGALLRLAATELDVFITVDSNLPYQQNPVSIDIAVIVLRARTTRLPDLRKLRPALHDALAVPRAGDSQLARRATILTTRGTTPSAWCSSSSWVWSAVTTGGCLKTILVRVSHAGGVA